MASIRKHGLRPYPQGTRFPISCIQCRGIFEVTPSRRNQKTCSKCHAARKSPAVPCENCGKLFKAVLRTRHRADGSSYSRRAKCCSSKCRKALIPTGKTRIPRVCLHCGCGFTIKKYGSNNAGKFCSRPCYWYYRNANKSWGPADPGKFGGLATHRKRCQAYRLPFDPKVTIAALLGRDGPNCWICGQKTVAGDNLLHPSIDHIVPLGAPENTRHGHVFGNTAVACSRCNFRKGAKVDQSLIDADVPLGVILERAYMGCETIAME